MTTRVLVTGASGFIGRHLVRFLKARGFWVRGVDLVRPEPGAWGDHAPDEFALLDLRLSDHAMHASRGINQVYQLASEPACSAQAVSGNMQIVLNLLEAAVAHAVERLLYPSSAAVYPDFLKSASGSMPLREDDALPAHPASLLGWEKLFGELMCRQYRQEHAVKAVVARLPEVYGPRGSACLEDPEEAGWAGLPEGLCRLAARAAADSRPAEVCVVDGECRSFLYIDDCVEGLASLVESGFPEPVNLCSGQAVSTRALVELVGRVSGGRLAPVTQGLGHLPRRSAGTDGRGICIDCSRARRVLGWEPKVGLEESIARLYQWVETETV